MTLVAKYIKKMPKNITAQEFLRGVTLFIAKQYKKADLPLLAQHPEHRLAASCIVYSRLQRQIWMVGDCQCLVGGELYDNPKPYEAVLAKRRAEFNGSMLNSGKATVESLRQNDLGRTHILPYMIEAMKRQNIDYAVIDGFKIPQDKVRIITLDFRPWTIVLASDGYPHLKPTLAESEDALQQQLATDPLNINTFLATKAFIEGNNSFDDRAYIRFTI